MGWILREDIAQEHADNIRKFTKLYKVRVRAFHQDSSASTVYDFSSSTRSPYGYFAATGEYRFHFPLYVKKWLMSGYPGDTDCVVCEYRDLDGNWLTYYTHVATAATTHTIVVPDPPLSSEYRILGYKKADAPAGGGDKATSFGWASPQEWFDITDFCSGEIRISRDIDPLTDVIKLPHFSVGINNADSRWNKDVVVGIDWLNFPQVHSWQGADPEATILHGGLAWDLIKKIGTKVMIEVKFFGTDWEDSDWIIIGSFNIRKFTGNSISGESAWLAKTELNHPTVEGKTADEIVRDVISMDGTERVVQLARQGQNETLTSENEFVGELRLNGDGTEDSSFTKKLDNWDAWTHCQDEKYVYFAKRANKGNGIYTMDIYRVTHGGDNPEKIGGVNGTHAWKDASNNILSDPLNSAVISNLNQGNAITKYMREFSFCCDEEYFYCSCLCVYHGRWGVGTTRSMQERFLLRLTKNGLGWGEITNRIDDNRQALTWSNEVAYTETYTTAGLKRRSRGQVDLSSSGMSNDPEDDATTPQNLWGPIMLFDDGGAEKLLVANRHLLRNSTGTPWEFWIVTKGLGGETKMNDLGVGIDIHCMMKYEDLSWFIGYKDNLDSGKMKLGVMDRDPAGNFYLKSYGEAEIYRVCKGVSFIGDSIYASGNAYNHTSEQVTAPGLRQIYQCVFKLDATNIIHEDHAVNNQYLSHRFPLLRYQGADISKDVVEYGQEYLSGDIYRTHAWTINLKTGYITLRQVLPSVGVGDTTLRISYDFINSFSFFIPESDSRLNQQALGKLSQSLLGVYGIDEYARLEKLPFIKYQHMSPRHSVNEYAKESVDDGEEEIVLNNTIGGSDRFISWTFTPDFDGIIDALRIPIWLRRRGDTTGQNPVAITAKIWCGGPDKVGGGELSASAYGSANKQTPDEEPLGSTFTLLHTGSFYIDKAKVGGTDASGAGESPYVWRGFDLSGVAFTVQAGKTYVMGIQMSITNALYTYGALVKMVNDGEAAYPLNQACTDSVTAGADISAVTLTPRLDDENFNGQVMLTVIEIKKSKQVIAGSNIVDALNPDISSGFVSKMGGSDSTFRVVDADYENVHTKGVDYSITYVAPDFWISFTTFEIDDVMIVQWMESMIDPPQLSDSGQYKLTEDSSYGDDSDVRKVSVIGAKKLPADVNVRINKIFEISPGLDLPVEVTSETSRQGESVTNVKDWNDTTKRYEDTQDSDEIKTFAFEFKDPFIAGTTGWVTRYGKGLSGDIVNTSNFTVSGSHDVPLFYKIWFSTASSFADENYHIMLKRLQYREWRLATDDDASDIVGNVLLALDPDGRDSVGVGNAPPHSASDPWITGDYFIVKHINGYYGEDRIDFVAYLSEERKFYINANGIVIEDPAFGEGDDLNPVKSIYPGKTMITTASPQDFATAPLFEYHGNSGTSDGYDSSYSASIEPWMATRINKVTIRPRGINAEFSNWGTYKQFLWIDVFGYPLNQVVGIKYRKKLSGANHVDAKEIKIDNDLISNEIVAKLKADQTIDFWGGTRNLLKRSATYNPAYYNGMIVRLTSETQNYDDQLFYVLGLDSILSSQNMQSIFRKLLEV